LSGLTKEIDVVDRYDKINQVAELYHKGTTNPTHIAKQLGIKRVEALELITEWKDIARNDVDIREQAQEALQGAIQHYAMLVARSWETVEQADQSSDLKTKATVIKNIADIEAKKVDMLQKAGLYDNASLGDEMAAQEEKMAILIGIIREVSGKCEKCKYEVARRLSKVTNTAEPMVVEVGEITPSA